MDVFGRIKVIDETKVFGDNGFRKREVVVTTDEQYPQHLMIEFTQDKCDLLNNFRIGEPVKISINLRGREWVNPQGETKYFNSIQGWKVERLAAQGAPVQQPGQPYTHTGPGSAADGYANHHANQQNNSPGFKEEEHDDLPF